MMAARFTEKFRAWSAGATGPADAMVFFAVLLVISMPLSPFLLAIAMWGLVFTAFWHLVRENPAPTPPVQVRLRWWRLVVRSFENLFQQPVPAIFLLLLAIPAASGLWSEDMPYWLERVRVRLPFLVLPWAFANLPRLSGRRSNLVLYVLVWLMMGLCIGVGIHFFLHQTEVLHAMYQGRPMPTPRNHIRFSLMVATAVLAGAWLWQQRYVWRYTWERHVLAGAVVFLFGFIHFLAVRSGLAALYAALLFVAVRWVWRSRRWVLASGLALLAVATFCLAIRMLPSLKQKWEYTVYDWQQFQQEKGATYSDSERWVSMKTGWLIWQKHPWIGAGAGDLPAETTRVLAEHFPKYRAAPKLPHNQFLYLLAGTGLLGLAGSLLVFLYPLFVCRRPCFPLWVFQVMAGASFLVEYTLETAMGVAWYLFYTLWLLNKEK